MLTPSIRAQLAFQDDATALQQNNLSDEAIAEVKREIENGIVAFRRTTPGQDIPEDNLTTLVQSAARRVFEREAKEGNLVFRAKGYTGPGKRVTRDRESGLN